MVPTSAPGRQRCTGVYGRRVDVGELSRAFGAGERVKIVFTPMPHPPHPARYACPMRYDAHQPIINDLEARILTIRDSL